MTIPTMTREQWEERIRYETIDENEPGKPRTAHPYYIVDTRKLWVPVTEAWPEEDSLIFGWNNILKEGSYGKSDSSLDGLVVLDKCYKSLIITHWTYTLLPDGVE